MYMHGKLMAKGEVYSRKVQSLVPVEWFDGCDVVVLMTRVYATYCWNGISTSSRLSISS